jgi:uncharacterized protein YndB with AHSA1/START domain
MSTDRIEKRVVLRAPRSRVWRAIADSREFGTWFGIAWEGPFEPGATVRGRITIPKYEHLFGEVTVERIEPERLLTFRWHPNAHDPKEDYSKEPTTLVEFHLKETPEGTELTVIESGFDQLPLSRRGEAFRSNEGGWAQQIANISRHVSP